MSICEAIAASLVAISAAQRQIDNLGSGEAAWSAAQVSAPATMVQGLCRSSRSSTRHHRHAAADFFLFLLKQQQA